MAMTNPTSHESALESMLLVLFLERAETVSAGLAAAILGQVRRHPSWSVAFD